MEYSKIIKDVEERITITERKRQELKEQNRKIFPSTPYGRNRYRRYRGIRNIGS